MSYFALIEPISSPKTTAITNPIKKFQRPFDCYIFCSELNWFIGDIFFFIFLYNYQILKIRYKYNIDITHS